MRKQYRWTFICLAVLLAALTACSQAPSGGDGTAETTGAPAVTAGTEAAGAAAGAGAEESATTTGAGTEESGAAAGAGTEESGTAAAGTEAAGTAAGTGTEESGTAAAGAEAELPKDPYDYTDPAFFNAEDYAERMPVVKLKGVQADGSFFNIESDVKGFGVLQGSCTDGEYAYLFLHNKRAKLTNKEFPALAMDLIYKVDLSTWEIAAVSEPLALDHANSATFNSKTGQLIVCNGAPDDTILSIVDPETLTMIDQITLRWHVDGISYNESRDQYALRLSAGQDFFITTDADFQETGSCEGVDTALSIQNIDSDDDYIYILNTGVSKNPGVETVTVYDWDGNYVSAFRLDSKLESEGLFHVGDTRYAAFYNGSQRGGRIYEMEFDPQYLTYTGDAK